MEAFSKTIKAIIETAGRISSILILLIMAIVSFEVISRYAFNAPTSWAWLINKQLFGVFVLIGGSYALIHKSHIQIEMLYDHFPKTMKTFVRWLTLAAALCFLGGLLWKSAIMGMVALKVGEKATGVFKLPLYPLKMFMPFSIALFILGCIAVYGKKK
ncbi:MAG: TRAP transporter small permease [Proteobacteria bacterium]|nr:TRAP transporter small permease [Pseudomonadota bacterium]MBU1584427.1 TRAP transporter small permease [Pseudomonadota bacterium]MBU2453647.1 TRAP transporter small permease [Pseudomonadota bacterium]MBU2630403.1 TRAP transporter small permease [Pseudomonadota bacterium]